MKKHGAREIGPKRAILYTRISDRKGEDTYSLLTQEAACRAHCQARGYVVVAAHTDVRSGADLFERVGLSAVRVAVRSREVDVVVAHALDRLSRDQRHLGLIFSEFDHAGVAVELVTEELSDSPEGTLLQAARGFVAEVERLKIVERTQRGTKARAESGKLLAGSKPLYGYRWRDESKGALDIDPETGPVVQHIFATALRGTSLRSIARALTAQGVTTPGGKAIWWASTVADILGNLSYAGEAAAYRRSSLPSVTPVPLPEGTIPALVDAAAVVAARERLAKNQAQAVRNNRDPEATLLRAGIARCAYCRNALGVANRKDRSTPFYRCSNTNADRYGCPHHGIAAPHLDGPVWDWVAAIVTDPAIITARLEQSRDHDPSIEVLAKLECQLADVVMRQQRLTRAISRASEAAAEPLITELEMLATEGNRLSRERVEAEAQRYDHIASRDRLADLETWCRRVAGNLPNLTYHEKRQLLEELGVTVFLWRADAPQRWEIVWSCPGLVDT